MRLGHPESGDLAEAVIREMLRGFAESAAGLCLCDDSDLIRYANPSFRAAFFPTYDGRPADFMATITTAVKADTGIRLVSTSIDKFAEAIRQRRQVLVGSHSFSTDMMDDSWWSVTETKLSNGWILIVAQDISALKNEEARLRDAHETALAEAQTDFLTGIPNRRHGLRRAEALRDATGRKGIMLALLDIDHFKAINDTYGHDAGDRALVHFSRYMAQMIAPEDQFSRLGGDEFMLVSARGGLGRLETGLRLILAAMPNVLLPGLCGGLRLSISVGVARSRPGETWPSLMQRADMALFNAKGGGRNRIEADRSHQSTG